MSIDPIFIYYIYYRKLRSNLTQLKLCIVYKRHVNFLSFFAIFYFLSKVFYIFFSPFLNFSPCFLFLTYTYMHTLNMMFSSFKLWASFYNKDNNIQKNSSALGRWWGSFLDPNSVIYKDFKSCTYFCYVRCSTLRVWLGWMPCPKHTQLIILHI